MYAYNAAYSSSSTSKTSIASALSPLTSQIFADNIDKMKEAAISYYTDSRLPKNVGDSETMTLSDMIGKKIIVALVDKNGKVKKHLDFESVSLGDLVNE